MTRLHRLRIAVAVVLAALAAGAGALVPATAGAARPPGTELLAQRGFGDPRNGYAWSMAWFKGRLYVGTARQEACVENITVDFFLRVSERYVKRPLPGVRCPADPYDMDLRAEVWQYTPATRRWRMVYRSPAVPNPRARGKTIARDIGYRGMVVHRDPKGRRTLYIGGVSADEYIPELKREHPPRILATRDGRRFRAIGAHDMVVRMPYGDYRPIGFRSLRVWHGRLFVTATPGLTGDGAIFEVHRPWSRRPRFRQITPKRLAVFETETFAGALYAGTGDRETGYGVYRISGKRRPYRVRPVITGGAGRGQIATSVVAMHVFDKELYVGSSGWYNEDDIPISELVRINSSGSWQVVAGEPREVGGHMMRPVSGLSDGFGNIFAAHFWRMVDYRGAFYVGTNDWSWVIQAAIPVVEPWVQAAVQSALMSDMGFDMWSSCNGREWYPVTRDAYGGNPYDFGARNMVATPAGLFVGSANHAEGLKVWRTRTSACDGLVARPGRPQSVRKAKRPARKRGGRRAAAPDGTAIAWRGSPDAARYRVLRADYDALTLHLQAPPLMPNGFRLADQPPTVVPAGTPGSAELTVPLVGELTPVATTRDTRFVDRTAEPGERYAYEVIAESASGRQSPPSPRVVVTADDAEADVEVLDPPADGR